MRCLVRSIIFIVLAAVVFFLLIQLIPYGRNHSDPPVVQEPNWDSPQTRALAAKACFDCHSNQTTWPWYSNIAPISWLVQHDVDEGRRRLNFSEWRPQRRANELGGVVIEGEMPPFYYLILHPNNALSQTEKEALANGLVATNSR
jgi:hypothetical protein